MTWFFVKNNAIFEAASRLSYEAKAEFVEKARTETLHHRREEMP